MVNGESVVNTCFMFASLGLSRPPGTKKKETKRKEKKKKTNPRVTIACMSIALLQIIFSCICKSMQAIFPLKAARPY